MPAKILLAILTALTMCFDALAQEREKEIPADAPAIGYKWYPRYVTFLPYDKLDSVLAYAETDIVPVVYAVNKYDLVPNPQTDSIAALIDRIRSDKRIRLAYVWIGGSASPEGPADWNRQLGQLRADALGDWLLDNTSLPENFLRIENLEEDWNSVVRVLENGEKADFPNKDRILEIIYRENDNEERKKQIQAIDSGRTWRKMINELFKPFRNSRIVIVCSSDMAERIYAMDPWGPAPECEPVLTIKDKQIPPKPEYWFISVKTNALWLAALTANIGVEVQLHKQLTLDIPAWYSPYDITPTRKMRLFATQPEIRFWPERAGNGHFVGLHTHVAGFNVAINDHGRYQDPNHALWGMGISYGYAIELGKQKRWAVEFNIGAGFAEYDYDIYRNWENGPKVGSGSDWYWGITRAGISISYKWYVEKGKRRGQ